MFRTAPAAHPDQAALELLVEVLTDEPTGRLYKALVEAKKAYLVRTPHIGGLDEKALLEVKKLLISQKPLLRAYWKNPVSVALKE